MSEARKYSWFIVLLVILCVCPVNVWAQDETKTEEAGDEPRGGDEVSAEDGGSEDDGEKTSEDQALARSLGMNAAEDKAWQLVASTGLSVGIGAFVADPNARRTRVRYNASFGLNYNIPFIDTTVSIGTGFSQWLSRGGGQNEPQEFRWSDSSLSFFRPIYSIPVLDIFMIGSLGFGIPTSRMSQQSDLITRITPSLTFIRRFGPLTLIYDITYAHNFHKYTSTTYDPSDVDILSRQGGAEDIAGDVIAAGGVLTERSLFNTFGVNFGFSGFLLAVRFGFGDFWGYDNNTVTELDEYTSPYADVGRGHSQISFGTLRLSYMASQHFIASLWVTSQQPWKTADNSGFRFPFFDFESPANNFTYLGTTITGFY